MKIMHIFKPTTNIIVIHYIYEYSKPTCLSRSADVLLSKSIACFAFMSGFSLIFSMMNIRQAIIASTFPVIRQTLSDVPVKAKSHFKMQHAKQFHLTELFFSNLILHYIKSKSPG